jgi:hypothetical protein
MENLTEQKGYYKGKLKEFRELHKSKGLCIDCNNNVKAGYVRCQEHLDYHRMQQKIARGKK